MKIAEALKEKILRCFDSTEMCEYLYEHFEELDAHDLVDIVGGALKPIEYKADLMAELVELFPCPVDNTDFQVYAEMYRNAISDMNASSDEQAVYLLNRYYCDETDNAHFHMSRPFFSFDSAREYIRKDTERQNCNDYEVLIWYEIEKWVGSDSLELKATYTVSDLSEVWDCLYSSEESHFYHPFGIDNALGLNLPVPFSVGDVITLDCRPFAPLGHGVIIHIGDNTDCCCVQCLYLKNDGKVDVGALKHSSVFDGLTPNVSPLYKATCVYGELLPEEAFMLELGKELAMWYNTSPHEYDDFANYKLWNFIEGCTPQEFIEKVRNANK